jgi:hypothetical protein
MRLVDSDVIIWNWRGRGAAATVLAEEPFAISAVTYMELVQGMRNARELKRLQSDFKLWQTHILPITEGISRRATQLVEAHFLTTCNSPMRSSQLLPWSTSSYSSPPMPSTSKRSGISSWNPSERFSSVESLRA